MGKRGPAPKPTAIKKLEGNLGKRPLNENEPEPQLITQLGIAPQHLSKEAQAMYQVVSDVLIRCKVLTEADANILERYCDTWVRWQKAAAFLREHGETYQVFDKVVEYQEVIDEKTQKVIKNKIYKKFPSGWAIYPEVKIYSTTAAMLTKYEQELGLTPASRSKISTLANDLSKGKKTVDEVANDNPFQYN